MITPASTVALGRQLESMGLHTLGRIVAIVRGRQVDADREDDNKENNKALKKRKRIFIIDSPCIREGCLYLFL